MIRPTTDTERLREAFYRVFKSRDPFSPAGRNEFPVRVVLYETDMYGLEEKQFAALMGAIHECGEREFFISMVETEADPFRLDTWNKGEHAHWVCEEPVTFEEYVKLNLFIENAIYSSSGAWGVLLSHELHALLVCQQSFWEAFAKRYPNWKQDLEQFVELWRYHEKERGIDVSWLGPLIAYLIPVPR